MHLFPQPLDEVVIGRVQWEMQHHAVGRILEVTLDRAGFVGDIVVEHHMQSLGAAISALQLLQELNEDCRVLRGADAVDNAAGTRIQGTEDIALTFFPGVSTTNC
jgi:hypothetical protein